MSNNGVIHVFYVPYHMPDRAFDTPVSFRVKKKQKRERAVDFFLFWIVVSR